MNTRKLALKLLLDCESQDKYVNLALSSHMTDALSDEERRFLTALLYTTVEHKLTYDYYIGALSKRNPDDIDFTTRNILRLGFCQILDMENVPDFAAVNESVNLSRNTGERSFVNAILRSVIREKDNLPLPKREKNAARYFSVKYSFALWMVKEYIKLFGEENAEKLLKKFSEIPPTDLTVNTEKISVDDFISMLRDNGLHAERSNYSKISIRIPESISPKNLPGFEEGYFFVQDSACSAAIEALMPRREDFIVDVCSCPGGKSFAAAILMGGGGEIHSFDIHESKLSLISEGKARLGFSGLINERVCDAREPAEDLFEKADKVICDVPCSGLGVLSKKPDLRYKSESGIAELPELQYEILRKSSKYLKPGGRLMYSTCTLNKVENEDVVERFLNENKGFHRVDFKIGDFSSENGSFLFIPYIHNTDGFFVSLIEKDVF